MEEKPPWPGGWGPSPCSALVLQSWATQDRWLFSLGPSCPICTDGETHAQQHLVRGKGACFYFTQKCCVCGSWPCPALRSRWEARKGSHHLRMQRGSVPLLWGLGEGGVWQGLQHSQMKHWWLPQMAPAVPSFSLEYLPKGHGPVPASTFKGSSPALPRLLYPAQLPSVGSCPAQSWTLAQGQKVRHCSQGGRD